MTNPYNPDDLDKLLCRAIDLLGIGTLKAITQSPPRNDAFSTALGAAIKFNDCDPLKVTDDQIIGALEIADEVWPVEADVIATALLGQQSDGGAS